MLLWKTLLEYIECCYGKHYCTVATDGAPATMIGHYRGCASLLTGKAPGVLTICCVLHRHHPVAKNFCMELYAASKVCIRSVNKIKVHPLSSRLFAMLCKKMTKRVTNSFYIRK